VTSAISENYTIRNLADIEDQAEKAGFGPALQARFPREELGCEEVSFSLQRLAPDAEAPFGHRHEQAEEVYVVLSGSGRMRLDDEVVDLKQLDAIRVAPAVLRAFAAGPVGAVHPAHDNVDRFDLPVRNHVPAS
jgi:mannose-6-phosphate isomerase-like protein (cupin superfamily)